MKNYNELSDADLRVAVAEALGWTKIKFRGPDGTYSRLTGVFPPITVTQEVPYFPSDLNACHEFEEALGDGQKADYGRALFDILGLVEHMNAWGWFDLAHATARQRCIALLETLKPEGERS